MDTTETTHSEALDDENERVDRTEHDAPAALAADESERVGLQQGLAREIHAREVRMIQSAAGSVEADDVSLVQGAVGLVRAEEVTLSLGGAGLIAANRVRVSQGGAQTVLAREVSLEQGGAGAVLARDVEVRPQTMVGFLVAQNVRGEVRTLFDWRGALAFGAAFAVLSSILRAFRRR